MCNIIPSLESLPDIESHTTATAYPDPLASLAAVRFVFEKLRSALPEPIPRKDKELVRLLYAARHAQRYPATDMRRGRPGNWKCEELLKVAA